MSDSLLSLIPLDQLTPTRLWHHLEPATRVQAAQAFYEEKDGEAALKRGADAAIARALRFRDQSVRKLPAEKKAGYLARLVPPDEMLAAALLQSLHLGHRRPLLGAFLDALGIPHKDGVIDPEAKVDPPKPEAVSAAVDKVYGAFPAAEVDLYLASLLAVDPESWSALRPALAARV